MFLRSHSPPSRSRFPPNVFAEMDRKVAAAVAGGADVIDLAKGNPDAFPADFIRDVAKRAVERTRERALFAVRRQAGLPSGGRALGIATRTASTWIGRPQLFAVEGAVDGLAALFAVFVSPGDAVAYVDPYYPSYHCMTVMSRAEEILLPSLPECGFLPDLDAVPADTWERVKVLVLNYPNNPTGAQAPARIPGTRHRTCASASFRHRAGLRLRRAWRA